MSDSGIFQFEPISTEEGLRIDRVLFEIRQRHARFVAEMDTMSPKEHEAHRSRAREDRTQIRSAIMAMPMDHNESSNDTAPS